MVAYSANPTQSKSYALGIDRPSLPSGLVIVGDLPPVRVTVVGTADAFRTFDARTLRVTASFAGVKIGQNEVPIHVESGDPNVHIQVPSTISVRVDELASTNQNVAIERVHTLPSGYHEQANATTVTPASVKIDGPKSQLTGIQAVVQVDLDGFQAGFSQAYLVVVRDANKKAITKGITVTPSQVTVKMAIQADAVTVPRPVGWTLTGQPAPGFRVTNVQVAPLEVLATGLQNTMNGLLLATDPVDISGARGDVVRTVSIRPPAGVEVNQKTAQVHVFISPAPGVSPSP